MADVMAEPSFSSSSYFPPHTSLDANLAGNAAIAGVNRSEVRTGELYMMAAGDIPLAIRQSAQDAWDHKLETVKHVGIELSTALVTGAAIGYVIPAKGPAAIAVSAAFTIPMAFGAVRRLYDASQDLAYSSKDADTIAKELAGDTVSGAADLSLSLVGGIGGTALGVRLAKSDTVAGHFAQWGQRKVNQAENESILWIRDKFGSKEDLVGAADIGAPPPGRFVAANRNDSGTAAVGADPLQTATALDLGVRAASRTTLPIWQPVANLVTNLTRRSDQYAISLSEAPAAKPGATPLGLNMYSGSTHGHSRYSDGMGLPRDLYQKGIDEGQQVTAITDHNHLAARDGVKPGDPRADDEKYTPIIAAAPEEYVQTQKDAEATTIAGMHVSLVGIEMGTIGGVKHVHDGKGGGGHGQEQPEMQGLLPGSQVLPIDDGMSPSMEPLVASPFRKFETPQTPSVGDTVDAPPVKQDSPTDSAKGRSEDAQNPKDEHEGEHEHDLDITGAQDDPKRLVPYNFKVAQLESLEAAHLGGVNHTGLVEPSNFFEAIRQPKPRLNALFSKVLGLETTVEKKAEVVKYNDGDYKGMAEHLKQIKDTTGGEVIVTLNHPRFLADNNPALPDNLRGRDYGRKSFANDDEWRDQFVKPHVRGIELIKGGALNPNPVDKVPAGMIDLRSYTGYLGLGVEAGPLFGRDFHFGDPVGNPGATGFLASALDKPSILDSMRERRTIATTNYKNLNGYMIANDKFVMGSILDQGAVPDLTLKMRVAGDVDPDAQYTLKLYGDEKVLDGTDAAVIQTKVISGKDLLAGNNEVSFDPVHHKLGNNSLYFTEVARQSGGNTDKMWTSPIWVQPLTGVDHGLIARLAAGGVVSQWLPSGSSLTMSSGH